MYTCQQPFEGVTKSILMLYGITYVTGVKHVKPAVLSRYNLIPAVNSRFWSITGVTKQLFWNNLCLIGVVAYL